MTELHDPSPPDATTPGPTPGAVPEATAEAAAPAAGATAEATAPAAGGTPEPARPTRREARPLRIAIAIVAVLAGAALFLSGLSLGARIASTPGTPPSDAELFAPFWDTYRSITEGFVGPVDREKLVQGAIDGMIGALDDPYSSYMTPEELRRSRESIGGEFSGVGAEVTTQPTDGAASCDTIGPTCEMVIVAPIDGSPAERAGLLARDVVTAVDGATVAGQTLDAAIERIRGPKGTEVTLTLVRDGRVPFDLVIVRDAIVTQQVETRELADGTVEYVRLAAFSDNSATQLEAAIRKAQDAGITKFVLDLRDNPGGLVTAARSIASQFIAEGPIFWEEAADGTQVATNASSGGLATDPSVRMAVLVNGGSASASEIVAGALQDTGRGTLVGETTFGKGTVQQWVDLTPETGGFRLSVAKWLTPDKRWIHGTGLTPDVVVPTTGAGAGEPSPSGDPFIDAALEVLGVAPTGVVRPVPAARAVLATRSVLLARSVLAARSVLLARPVQAARSVLAAAA